MRVSRRAFILFRLSAVPVAACALWVAATLLPTAPAPHFDLLLFAVVIFICEFIPVPYGQDNLAISVTSPVMILVFVCYGGLPAMVVSTSSYFAANSVGWASAAAVLRLRASASTPSSAIRRVGGAVLEGALVLVGQSWLDRLPARFWWMTANLIGNSAGNCHVILVGAVVYFVAGGPLCGTHPSLQITGVGWFQVAGAGCLAWVAMFVWDSLNAAVITAVIEATQGQGIARKDLLLTIYTRYREYLTVGFGLKAQGYVMSLTVVLLYTYIQIGWSAVLLLFGALYMVRRTLGQIQWELRTYQQTVAVLGFCMQRSHPYTSGHLKRVAELSTRLAKDLRLSPESLKLIHEAGLLHDIGKVSVSEEVLDKTGALTDEEWTALKQHPVRSAEIVGSLPYLKKVVNWVKYHHKWADGSGYPEDEPRGGIPIEAAIIAVADAFDAMTDDKDMALEWVCDSCGYKPADESRPQECPKCGAPKKRTYREPLKLEDAIDQLLRGVGVQFYPQVVKAFLRVVEREGVHVDV